MAVTGLRSEELKRMRPMPITPIQAPRAVEPPKDNSITSRFAQAAMNKGINTAVEGGTNLATTYGKPLLQKGITALTPAAAAPTQAAIASNAVATGTAASGAGAGLMGSLGAAGTAALASPAAPIVGGLLAMKMLGFFSGGGHVGPLSKAQYKSAGGDVMTMSYGGTVKQGD